LLFGECIAAKYPVTWQKNSLPNPPVTAMLGEHTVKILRDAGVDKQEAAKMIEENVCISTAKLLQMKKQNSKAKIFTLLDKIQEFSDSILEDVRPKLVKNANCAKGMGPMVGTKIIELCNLVAGPMATMLLADQGAKVAKVEFAGKIDPARLIGENSEKKMGSVFTTLSRNKQLVELDDVEELAALVKGANVFVVDADEEERLGIDAKWASKLNSNLIYVRIDKGRGEYWAQAISGMAGEQTEYKDGAVNWLEMFISEKVCGYYAAGNMTAAVYASTGEGEVLNVDMEQVAVHWSMPELFWSEAWIKPKATPDFPSCGALFRLFTLKDGVRAFTGALTDAEWKGLSTIFKEHVDGSEIEERVTSGKWNSLVGRIGEVSFMWDWWEKVVIQYTEEEFMEKVKESGIFFGRCNTRQEVLNHAQVKHSKPLQVIDHPQLGKTRLARSAPIFSKTPTILGFPSTIG